MALPTTKNHVGTIKELIDRLQGVHLSIIAVWLVARRDPKRETSKFEDWAIKIHAGEMLITLDYSNGEFGFSILHILTSQPGLALRQIRSCDILLAKHESQELQGDASAKSHKNAFSDTMPVLDFVMKSLGPTRTQRSRTAGDLRSRKSSRWQRIMKRVVQGARKNKWNVKRHDQRVSEKFLYDLKIKSEVEIDLCEKGPWMAKRKRKRTGTAFKPFRIVSCVVPRFHSKALSSLAKTSPRVPLEITKALKAAKLKKQRGSHKSRWRRFYRSRTHANKVDRACRASRADRAPSTSASHSDFAFPKRGRSSSRVRAVTPQAHRPKKASSKRILRLMGPRPSAAVHSRRGPRLRVTEVSPCKSMTRGQTEPTRVRGRVEKKAQTPMAREARKKGGRRPRPRPKMSVGTPPGWARKGPHRREEKKQEEEEKIPDFLRVTSSGKGGNGHVCAVSVELYFTDDELNSPVESGDEASLARHGRQGSPTSPATPASGQWDYKAMKMEGIACNKRVSDLKKFLIAWSQHESKKMAKGACTWYSRDEKVFRRNSGQRYAYDLYFWLVGHTYPLEVRSAAAQLQNWPDHMKEMARWQALLGV